MTRGADQFSNLRDADAISIAFYLNSYCDIGWSVKNDVNTIVPAVNTNPSSISVIAENVGDCLLKQLGVKIKACVVACSEI